MGDNSKELAAINHAISVDYFKRFSTSISISSGVGIASILSFSTQFSDCKQYYFETVLLSLWGFFFALILSGLLPLVSALFHGKLGEYFASKNSSNQYKILAQNELDAFSNPDRATIENFNKPRSAISNAMRVELLSAWAKNDYKVSERWRRIRSVILTVSASVFLISIGSLIMKITINPAVLNCPI